MDKRNYEALFILPANFDEAGIEESVGKFRKAIEGLGAEIEHAGLWEKRMLAYPIDGHKEGNYCLLQFKSPPSVPAELNRLFRINDEVIRARVFLREE